MPRYQVTASFEPDEIAAIDRKVDAERFKSRYGLIRAAVLIYVGKKDKEPRITRTNREPEQENRVIDDLT
jgi:Arc/MetJ-type ribon-helix-helix transcriptional regulator